MPYVMNPSQRQWLIDVLSPTDKHMAYKVQIEAACRSISDLIINSLSSLNIPLTDLLHIIPHMQPRYYTISSSSNCYPHSVHITVSVHEFVNQEGKEFKGLCSSYLQVSLPFFAYVSKPSNNSRNLTIPTMQMPARPAVCLFEPPRSGFLSRLVPQSS